MEGSEILEHRKSSWKKYSLRVPRDPGVGVGAGARRSCRGACGQEPGLGGPCGPSLPWTRAHQAPDPPPAPFSPGLPREDRAPRRSGECQHVPFPCRLGIPRRGGGRGCHRPAQPPHPCSHATRGHRGLTRSQSAGRPGGGWPPRRERREGEPAAGGGGVGGAAGGPLGPLVTVLPCACRASPASRGPRDR